MEEAVWKARELPKATTAEEKRWAGEAGQGCWATGCPGENGRCTQVAVWWSLLIVNMSRLDFLLVLRYLETMG